MKSIAAAVAFLAAIVVALAQDGPFPAAPQPAMSEAQLDQLLAPVALYPDDVLANVLAASTYPLEVVSLQRWLDRNPGLSGDALGQALDAQPWDASVKALAPFASVVAMMSGELEWTQRLGNAFLASQADVMDAVQRLRRKARDAGSLQDNARERVTEQSGTVFIEPVDPGVIYVPAYDPRVVYGPWWWPDYPPYVWGWPYFGYWDFVVGGIAFGYGVHVGRDWHDHHEHPDWHDHNLHHGQGGGTWHHDPGHRGGVPYADSHTRDRFGGIDRGQVQQRQDFRGFDVHSRTTPGYGQPGNPAGRQAPATSQSARPGPGGSSPFSPVPHDYSRQFSERGRQSLAPAVPSANPAARAAPSHVAPSHPAPSQGAPRSAPSNTSRGKR
ncbi:MAG: DUF3300 domain-containing protein [Usitatibacter sp.]